MICGVLPCGHYPAVYPSPISYCIVCEVDWENFTRMSREEAEILFEKAKGNRERKNNKMESNKQKENVKNQPIQMLFMFDLLTLIDMGKRCQGTEPVFLKALQEFIDEWCKEQGA